MNEWIQEWKTMWSVEHYPVNSDWWGLFFTRTMSSIQLSSWGILLDIRTNENTWQPWAEENPPKRWWGFDLVPSEPCFRMTRPILSLTFWPDSHPAHQSASGLLLPAALRTCQWARVSFSLGAEYLAEMTRSPNICRLLFLQSPGPELEAAAPARGRGVGGGQKEGSP